MKRLFLFLWLTILVLPLTAYDNAIFAPFVSRLQGEVINNLVRLSWVDSLDVLGPVYVYRSAQPFGGSETLAGITPVEVPYGTGAYIDETGVPGILYYFAAASDEKGLVYDFPIISNNTIGIRTAEPMSALYVSDVSVPETNLWNTISGTGFTAGSDTMQGPAQLKHPRVFVRDIETMEGSEADGEEHFLAAIVRNQFAARDWETAKDAFLKILAMPLATETQDRARFYLGQCYYFLDQPRSGIYEFLAIQNKYPVEISDWVQASLIMLKN